jgi:hypothetical protein
VACLSGVMPEGEGCSNNVRATINPGLSNPA